MTIRSVVLPVVGVALCGLFGIGVGLIIFTIPNMIHGSAGGTRNSDLRIYERECRISSLERSRDNVPTLSREAEEHCADSAAEYVRAKYDRFRSE